MSRTGSRSSIQASLIMQSEFVSRNGSRTEFKPVTLVFGTFVSRTGSRSKVQGHPLVPGSFISRTGSRSSLGDTRTRTYKTNPIREDKSTPVFVYDRNEKARLILSDDTVPYTGEIPERLNETNTIELDVMAIDSRVARIENEGRLVTQDADGDFVEFIIRTIEDAERGIKRVEGEGSEYELIDEWLESYVQPSVDVKTALTAILEGTRWSVGEIDSYEQRSVELKHMSKRRAVNELIDMFNLEVKYTVETRGNRVVNRKINLYQSRGQDIGRRFEAGKDILSSKRVYDSTDIKTALYGLGAADETGNRLTFKDVEWRKSWGDPADKPLGNTWVGDPVALGMWGTMGGRKHKSGGYDGQEEDPAELLLNTWNELQQQNKLRDTYEVSVVNLGEILDYPHERVRLGDKVLSVDHEMIPVLESQAHIIEYRHNLNDRRLSTCTLGHFRARVNTDRTVADLEKDWNDKRGELDKKPTTDEVKEVVDNEATRAIAEAQKRIDAAKLELEASMIDLNDAMTIADDVFKNKITVPQNYKGYFEGDVGITGQLHVAGTIIGGAGAIIRGTLNADNLNLNRANILNANIQDANITGTLSSVDGTFVGKLIGASIMSGSTIDVTTDLRVGNNIYLGAASAGTKRIYFNQNANISAIEANIVVNADSLRLASVYGDAEFVSTTAGTKLQFGYDTSVYKDNSDRGRLKLMTPGAKIYADPNGTVYFLNGNTVVHKLYGNGDWWHAGSQSSS